MSKATGHSPVEHDPARRQEQSLGVLVGICLAFLLALGWAGQTLHHQAQDGVLHPPEKINPNEAPLGSLMRLPGVGLTRARAIVDHRNRPADQSAPRPAFADGQDLQRIKGFGPATVEDILPWLQFAATPQEYNRPSDAD